MTHELSRKKRDDLVGALRRGTVPESGLSTLAVGLERFRAALQEEFGIVEGGGAVFKAVRGEYGSGKTFFSRWLQEEARRRSWVTSEVQVSETETPLHRLETVYRRMVERLATREVPAGAMRSLLDAWFYALEEEVLAGGSVDEADAAGLLAHTDAAMEVRLASVSQKAPAFAAALRAYRRSVAESDHPTAEGILAWLGGQPNVAAGIKRIAGIKGDVDHFGALSFLQGLLVILKDAGHPGLVLVLDEVETLQRVRGDVRDRGLNALRQFIDEVDSGRFPGLYLLITGTTGFFEGPQGVSRLPPLAGRLHVDFDTEARFDNPRAVQVRLPGFTRQSLLEVGQRVREVYTSHAQESQRVHRHIDDAYLGLLADAVTGKLGGKVGVAPRIYLKKLVDVLDRVDQFADFDPRAHYKLTITDSELTEVEKSRGAASSPDDIELDV